MRPFLLLFALIVAAPLTAQETPVQIDPGMTRVEVIERLGPPANERSSNGYTYLFFINGCERTCGMNDLVTLKGDSVVDAIFRTARREYTGRSSSPAQNRTPRANRGPLRVGGAAAPDSVVARIVPTDSTTPPPERRPITDLTGPRTPPPATGTAGAPDTAAAGPQPSQGDRARPVSARTTAPQPAPVAGSQFPPGPPPQTGGRINPPAMAPDTSRNTPGTRPDTTRGERIPVTRSDTVMNPRTPVVIPVRPDSSAPPPTGRPPIPPPAQPPLATQPGS